MALRIVVTAGGTTESIDAVRTLEVDEVSGTGDETLKVFSRYAISNISKGKFPLEIARACSAKSTKELPVEVTLIAKQELVRELERNGSANALKLVPFRSFADLQNAIDAEFAKGGIDIFIMAAAVSDYSPVAVSGKISSSEDELVIRLKKNEKLLDTLHERLNFDSVLVGFKLLANVPHEKLVSVAHAQTKRARCDFTVANDAAQIDWERGWHPVVVVGQEGLRCQFAGLRAEVAQQLADEVFKVLDCNRGRMPAC